MINKTFKKREFLISVIYFLPIINFYIGEILNLYNIGNLSWILLPITYLFSLKSYYLVFKKSVIKNILITTVITIVFLINIGYSNNLQTLLFKSGFLKSDVFYFYGVILPLFLLTLDDFDLEELLYYFLKWSKIVIFLLIINFSLEFLVFKPLIRDYMTFSYSSVLAIYVLYYYGKREHRITYIISATLASIIIGVGGSRGSLVMLIIYLFLYKVFIEKLDSNKKIICNLFFLAFLIIFLLNSNNMLNNLLLRISNKGFKSRSLNILVDNEFLKSDGRKLIFLQLFPEVSLFGNGLYSDILITGFYSHNWILEIIFHFGVILGTFLVSLILFILFRVLYFSILTRSEIIIFYAITIITFFFWKLLISASYLTSNEFWLFLGISIHINIEWRKYRSEQI